MFLANTPTLYPMGADVDKLFDELFKTTFNKTNINKYPATDIYTEDEKTYIEVAITGFKENDIDVILEDDTLTIKAQTEDKSESKNYHIKNIAKRSFIRKFKVSDTVKDIKAKIENGILILELIQKPKEQTKKVIQIEN